MLFVLVLLLSCVLAPFTAMAQQHASPRPRTTQEALRLLPQPPPARPRPLTPHQQACRASRESAEATAEVEWEEWHDQRDALHTRLLATRGTYYTPTPPHLRCAKPQPADGCADPHSPHPRRRIWIRRPRQPLLRVRRMASGQCRRDGLEQ
jgi:hypothetical protein